jgi:hypothetical protein
LAGKLQLQPFSQHNKRHLEQRHNLRRLILAELELHKPLRLLSDSTIQQQRQLRHLDSIPLRQHQRRRLVLEIQPLRSPHCSDNRQQRVLVVLAKLRQQQERLEQVKLYFFKALFC